MAKVVGESDRSVWHERSAVEESPSCLMDGVWYRVMEGVAGA